MAHSITVKGSLTPAAGVLARDEVGTFADSPRLRSLIRKGYLILVSEDFGDDDADEPAEAADEPEVFPGDEEPAKNASTDEWRSFFTRQLPDVEIPEDATRAHIIDAWSRYTQQRDHANG